MKYGTEIDIDRLNWAISNDIFSGLTITELLTNTEGHSVAWQGLLFVLGGSSKEDVVNRMDPSRRRNLAANAQIDELIGRTMK